ncbi:unnamed protein product [Moneuplotes crassus]|uniref:Uncharacterized protein n=1 Tax=Euplotes crassus TaxID=5936 RepID=A0AAD1XVU2_EUPCR|nr:unnamed protein product [Moneuplotes crassus]
METIDQSQAKFEVSSKNKREWLKKKIDQDHLEYVRKLETDIMNYSYKLNELEEELEKNPPKLKSKEKEKEKKLALFRFKIDQARARISNSKEMKESMDQTEDDFFCHSDFSKFYGSKAKINNQMCEVKTSNGDTYYIEEFLLQLLYDHQIDGLHWLLEQHSSNRGSLLGDEMGLGKTITSLSLLSCLKATQMNSDRITFGINLLVCPATLQDQWKEEAKLWATNIDTYIFSQDIRTKASLSNIFKKYKKDGCVIIITYETLRNYRKWFDKEEIYYAILDEGHKIKNPKAKVTQEIKKLSIKNRLILTGTPIQNTIDELWCLIDFIQPGKLSKLEIFRDEYCSHILKAGSVNATSIEIAMAKECTHRLRVLIRPHILRRTKAMLTKACNLQSKNEYIVFCNPTIPQILITMKLRNKVVTQIRNSENHEIQADDLMLISKARKICNHPYLVFWDEGTQDLLYGVGDESGSEIHNKDDLMQLIFDQRDKSGKINIAEKLLDEWYSKEKTKVLIFSQTKIILDILGKVIESKGIKHKRIDGNTNVSKRMEIIKQFSEDEDCFAMLLTTRVGGLGLNLTAANKIIIFDPDWNPMVDMQASDRAARIGQKQDVTVYRLVCSDTVEEFIYQKQIFKQFMADKILNNPGAKRIFKEKIFIEYLLAVPKTWQKLYKDMGLDIYSKDERNEEEAKTVKALSEQVLFNFGEIKKICMKESMKKRDKKNMDKMFTKHQRKMIQVDKEILKKDKKFKKFYNGVLNDIKTLDSKEKGEESKEHEFVKQLLTRDEDAKEVNNDNLTIDERLQLMRLKNKTMEHLSKDKNLGENTMKLESSLAFTEDEISERIEVAEKELLQLFNSKSEQEGEASVSDSDMKENFKIYLQSPYFRKPFENMLFENCSLTDEKTWRLK